MHESPTGLGCVAPVAVTNGESGTKPRSGLVTAAYPAPHCRMRPLIKFCPHGHAILGDNVVVQRHSITCRTCAIQAKKKSADKYLDVKRERVERAIADDLAFLAAHPTRRSNTQRQG
jgi:hypothetical protein